MKKNSFKEKTKTPLQTKADSDYNLSNIQLNDSAVNNINIIVSSYDVVLYLQKENILSKSILDLLPEVINNKIEKFNLNQTELAFFLTSIHKLIFTYPISKESIYSDIDILMYLIRILLSNDFKKIDTEKISFKKDLNNFLESQGNLNFLNNSLYEINKTLNSLLTKSKERYNDYYLLDNDKKDFSSLSFYKEDSSKFIPKIDTSDTKESINFIPRILSTKSNNSNFNNGNVYCFFNSGDISTLEPTRATSNGSILFEPLQLSKSNSNVNLNKLG